MAGVGGACAHLVERNGTENGGLSPEYGRRYLPKRKPCSLGALTSTARSRQPMLATPSYCTAGSNGSAGGILPHSCAYSLAWEGKGVHMS